MNQRPQYKSAISSRSDILTLLSEACELEHGLACSYLYAAFSLKQSMTEGLTETQLHLAKKWAAQIFLVASQEMLHLSQAWNLLTAIGGTPYYFRPNFPQGNKYYPLNLPLKTEPFCIESLKRCILYELPTELNHKEFIWDNFAFRSEDDYDYKSVGQLYQLIASGFNNIDEKELFIADPPRQIGPDIIDFPEIIKVTDKRSALEAIYMITEQGEGTATVEGRLNSHYGIFLTIEEQYKDALAKDPGFSVARNCISNPITFDRGNYSAGQGEIILNETTRDIADLFDDIYNLMLKVLQYVFSNALDNLANKQLASYSIQLMVRIIKPLGEGLTMMPAYPDQYSRKAGPCFGLTRHIPFPDDMGVTRIIIRERHDDITIRFKYLVESAEIIPVSLKVLPKHLEELRLLITKG